MRHTLEVFYLCLHACVEGTFKDVFQPSSKVGDCWKSGNTKQDGFGDFYLVRVCCDELTRRLRSSSFDKTEKLVYVFVQ